MNKGMGKGGESGCATLPEFVQMHISTYLHKPCQGDPERHTAVKLAEQYINYGVLTHNEPLWVHEAPEWEILPSSIKTFPEGYHQAFSVGYIKGAARSSVLLSLIGMFCQDNVNISEVPLSQISPGPCPQMLPSPGEGGVRRRERSRG